MIDTLSVLLILVQIVKPQGDRFRCDYQNVRLVGTAYAGEVEVFCSNQWFSVCGEGWNDEAAEFICRMLNFTNPIYYAHQVYYQTCFGDRLQNYNQCVHCNFSSTNITCTRNRVTLYTSYASVVCDVPLTISTTTDFSQSVSSTSTTSPSSVQLEESVIATANNGSKNCVPCGENKTGANVVVVITLGIILVVMGTTLVAVILGWIWTYRRLKNINKENSSTANELANPNYEIPITPANSSSMRKHHDTRSEAEYEIPPEPGNYNVYMSNDSEEDAQSYLSPIKTNKL